MISLQRSMHSSQMYTPGPAINFLTCFWLFPQNEHFSRSPPSPNFATTSTPSQLFRPASASALGRRDRREVTVGDDLVDEAVRLRLCRAHDEVAVGVLGDPLDGLSAVEREQLVEELAHAHDLLGLDLDVDRLTGRATVRLVDQHAGVGQD